MSPVIASKPMIPPSFQSYPSMYAASAVAIVDKTMPLIFFESPSQRLPSEVDRFKSTGYARCWPKSQLARTGVPFAVSTSIRASSNVISLIFSLWLLICLLCKHWHLVLIALYSCNYSYCSTGMPACFHSGNPSTILLAFSPCFLSSATALKASMQCGPRQ